MAAKTRKAYAVPAVDAMLDIVEYMTDNPREVGVTELSKKLDISTNLAFRIMKRLTERGYAESANDSGMYTLSTRFFSVGMKLYSRFDLRVRARKHLEKLSEETCETAQIQIPDGEQIVVLDCINPRKDFFIQIIPGSRLYYHANAFGKAVLAYMDKRSSKAILKKGMPKLTDKTVTDPDELLRELDAHKEQGLFYDSEEYVKGLFCVGVPVFDMHGHVSAGVGITCLASSLQAGFPKKIRQLVVQCAEAISQDIGYQGEFYTNAAERG